MASRKDQFRTLSKGKSASMSQGTSDKVNGASEKANWEPTLYELFLNLCAEQVLAGNRPTICLSKEGWKNVRNAFNEKTGKKYVQKQFKNHWNYLKKDWSLLHGETGLGIDHASGTIDASDEWWEIKLQTVPEAIKFRNSPLTHLSKLEIMFLDTVATGEYAWTPSSGVLPPHMRDANSEDEGSDENDGTQHLDDIMGDVESGAEKTRKKRGSASVSRLSKKKPKRVTTVTKLSNTLEKIMEAVTSDSVSSVGDPGSQCSMGACLDILKKIPGVQVADPLYLFGAHLFKKTENREMFIELPSEARLPWLKAEQSIFNR